MTACSRSRTAALSGLLFGKARIEANCGFGTAQLGNPLYMADIVPATAEIGGLLERSDGRRVRCPKRSLQQASLPKSDAGMRPNEVLALNWERVDREAVLFRADRTNTGAPQELAITRQTAAIPDRRKDSGDLSESCSSVACPVLPHCVCRGDHTANLNLSNEVAAKPRHQ